MFSSISTSSGLLTADTAVATRPCVLHSVILIGDGTNAPSIVVYDHASAASGTAVAKLKMVATGVYTEFKAPHGIECNKGIYADIAGTGAEFIIHYSLA